MRAGPLDVVPLWALFIGTILAIVIVDEVGRRLGARRRKEALKDAPVGAIVGASLGLLGFILAFTFGIAATRFDSRRELLQSEITAIAAMYLRADFLPEPRRGDLRALIRKYVDERLRSRDPRQLASALDSSAALQRVMWARVADAGRQAESSEMMALLVESTNEVIEMQSRRVGLSLRARIPYPIWGALYLVTLLTMGSLGFFAGIEQAPRSIAGLALIVSFSAILMLIADLDRAHEGLLEMNYQGLENLRRAVYNNP
jgi:hypothetical protein